jgi:hypothetical protein
LQIATIEAAEKVFAHYVMKPALAAEPGLPQLLALMESYLTYLETRIFRGGCFFAAVAGEYDDRPGRIRDRIAQSIRSWRDKLEAQIEMARSLGELNPETDARHLGYELRAIMQEANFSRMMEEEDPIIMSRKGLRRRLWDAATPQGRESLRFETVSA